MRQSVVTVKRITDKINKVTTTIDDIEKTMADLSDRRTTIEDDINSMRFAVETLYKEWECYHLTSSSELEKAEEIYVKIRDIESKICLYIFIQQQYLEKYLYAKKLLESLLEADPKTIAVRRPSPLFEPYPEFVNGISREDIYWGIDWGDNSPNIEEEE